MNVGPNVTLGPRLIMGSDALTVRAALAYGRGQLKVSDSPALDARLLLQHVLQVDHAYLIAHDDAALASEDEVAFRRLVRRATLREPVPYLTGRAPFYGRQFMVSPTVLIPRPETELLVEHALRWIEDWSGHDDKGHAIGPRIVDVGTGSGCIAITLALEARTLEIEAVDVSVKILEIARRNAVLLGAAERLVFRLGSLLEPVDGRLDLILANLPYIADPEWTALDDGIKWYEPEVALRGGPKGLDVIRQLLEQAADKLAPGGAILLEIGWQQGRAVQNLAARFFPQARIETLVDYGGRDRLVSIQTVG
ncbi:MAG: peptide chain release factor N(5)-glutamine methyltransferase [Chloroflexota bacterium]|nr:MAG: peptide chain release factor N(5)-glutamine methyltransferase [Chloroflexota bacterium]